VDADMGLTVRRCSNCSGALKAADRGVAFDLTLLPRGRPRGPAAAWLRTSEAADRADPRRLAAAYAHLEAIDAN